MKRHPALVPLSHDHNQILHMARLLRRGGGGEGEGEGGAAPARARARMARELLPALRAHFRVEERALRLLPEALADTTDRVIEEHRALEAAFGALSSGDVAPATLDTLEALGDRLYRYVRQQERGLFEQLQRACTPAVMRQIGGVIAKHRDPAACRVSWPR